MAGIVPSPMRGRHAGMALAALWLVLLWVPLAQMLFRVFPETRLEEKRRRAEWPVLPSPPSADGLKRYLAGVDAFITDHFGFRDRLIDLNNRLHLLALRSSPSDKVVLGKESWLFYNARSDGQNLVDYCGLAPLSAKHLADIRKNLRLIHDRLKARGVDFYVLVAPSKHTLYPEMLPDDIVRLAGETRLDQITGYLGRHEPDLGFVDPRAPLREAKESGLLYYPGDTHWSQRGAFVALRALMERIGRDHPELPPIREEELRWSDDPGLEMYDLAAIAGVPDHPGRIPLPTATLRSAPAAGWRPLPEGYPDHPSNRSSSYETEGGGPRLLMYHDSFANSFVHLLNARFSRSVFLWCRKMDEGIVVRERPDIVVLELGERFLGDLTWTDLFIPAS